MSALVYIENGIRCVAKPRDLRGGYPCSGCHFAFVPPGKRRCPRDRGGNLLCRYGAGWIWRKIPRLKAHRPMEIESDEPVQTVMRLD